MSNLNIKGVDISNNNSISDLSTLSSNGVQYVYLKATEGATFKDNTSIARCTQAKNLGLKVGFYHFLVSTSTPEAQMENAYNYLKNNNLLDQCDLKFALDVETNFDGIANYLLRAIAKWRELSDLDICIYTYSSFVTYLTSIKDSIKDIPCWIANYTSSYSNVPTTFFNTICGWQYSENGTIGGFTGDCNLFSESCLANSIIEGEWILDNTGWWYKHTTDGSYTQDSWEKIDGYWYLFDSKGYMTYSWQYSNGGNWYYLGNANDGAMKTGWLLQENNWYYLNNEGAMVVGWYQINSIWYYFNSDGSMKTGWIKDDGKDYLLDSNGHMYHDCTAYGYSFNHNGHATKL